MKENYERLKPIVGAIVLCGRKGMALHGHTEDGPLYQDDPSIGNESDKESLNEGYFRAILRYRVDDVLKQNLLSAPKNATYLSKMI